MGDFGLVKPEAARFTARFRWRWDLGNCGGRGEENQARGHQRSRAVAHARVAKHQVARQACPRMG